MKLTLQNVLDLAPCWPLAKLEAYFCERETIDLVDVLYDSTVTIDDRVWLGLRLMEKTPMILLVYKHLKSLGMNPDIIHQLLNDFIALEGLFQINCAQAILHICASSAESEEVARIEQLQDLEFILC